MLLDKKAQLEWSLGIAEGTHGPQGEEDEIANHLKVLAAEVRRLQKISDCLDAEIEAAKYADWSKSCGKMQSEHKPAVVRT